MDLRRKSTRVRAPDLSSSRRTVAARVASMKPIAQSPRDGGRLMKATGALDKNLKPNFRSSIRIATWNVLTLAHTGYPEAVAQQLVKYNISMAGLTEARLVDNGLKRIEDYTMIYSGASDHTKGVALMLNKRLASSMISWHPVSVRLLCARLAHKHGHLTVIVAYAPPEPSPDAEKDTFYQQLQSVVSSVPPHDITVILGDLNAVSGTDRLGFESVVGNYGSGTVNNNSSRLLSMCAANRLSILGSWFARKDIHRHTWICNDGHTRKELDHIITNNRSFFKSIRVYRGAEAAANTDHRLVVADAALHPFIARKKHHEPHLDTTKLMQDSSLAHAYNVAVSNAFTALSDLPEDPEEAWTTTRQTILKAATSIIPLQRSQHRPWLSAQTMKIIDDKKTARLNGDLVEWRRLKGIYKAKARTDLENYYSAIADEAEEGFQSNNLRPAYRAIKRLRGGQNSGCNNIPVTKLDGTLCTTPEQIADRWKEHYVTALNHPPSTPRDELNNLALAASTDPEILADIPTTTEIVRAIRRLKNGK